MREVLVRSSQALILVMAGVLAASCGGGGGSAGSPPFASPGAGDPDFGGGNGGNGGGTGQTGDGTRPEPDATVVPSNDEVQGTVLSASTGEPVSSAQVAFGGVNDTTNAQGRFSVADHPATNRLIMEVAASNYETTYRVTRVVNAVPSLTVFKLIPYGTTQTIDAAAGGTTQDPASPLRAVVPAGALEDGDGVGATGDVDLRVTRIALGSDSYLLSGDYTDGSANALESFGGAVVSVDQDIQAVAGAQIELRIPVSTRSSASPATANLYYFDPATARWVQEGQATLTAGSPAYYTAIVGRFGQWMVGQPLTGSVTITGCVEDDTGAPAANVSLAAEGISYSGVNYTMTDAQGQFSLTVRPNSDLIVSGNRGAHQTNARSVTTASQNMSLTGCLTLPSTDGATVRLTWGENPRDIDSHLHVPGGAHVYYVNKGSLTAEPFASLDVDDTSGFGPEVTTVRRPKVGIYRFYLHNYSGTFSPGMTGSPTRVELNYLGRVVAFSPPSGEGSARYWHLFDLRIGENCEMTLYRYNRWRADIPANPNTGTTAQACTP
ncbi:hypothetical protein M8A51_03430 [Schlegelella sp. S2-27]|uniref:Carboxypeptidase regulatory-like domain-containing protein n=1 Tax=Caldimonas mangrovi TaxID=2944811 RepID=A0ABT0YIQ0_9BURK|nr:hypothetical protein [Caldimonas mangrovi]MCM5678580.1 hypothetical protein [Caldimonas mangrovi]